MDNERNTAAPAASSAPASNYASRDSRDARPMRPRKKKKVCAFCAEKIDYIDYKDVARLRKSLTDRAKILPRRVTGTCAKHQRQLTEAVKRARTIALIPYISD